MLGKLFKEKDGLKLFFSVLFYIVALIVFSIVDCAWYVELIVYGAIYLVIGYEHIIGAIKEFKDEPFNEDFLMVVASIGALCLGEFADGAAVMILFTIGEFFEEYAEEKSENSITALTSLVPKTAVIFKDGVKTCALVSDIKIGDVLLLKAGDILPCDGVVIEGSAYVNNSALTGESLPISRLSGDFVNSGGVVSSGLIKVRAEKIAEESAAARILELVKEAEEKKSSQERFITKFAKIYTPIVLCVALIVAILPSLITGEWSVWLLRALNFLVVSCPCALVISVPMAFFVGIGKAFSNGIIVKGGSVLERASKITSVAFDKTGTLTNGAFEIKGVFPFENKDEILSCAAICESCSNHAIAKAILKEVKSVDASSYDFEEIRGHGIIAKNEKVSLYVGKRDFLIAKGVQVPHIFEEGTLVFVAKNDEYLGYILIGDKERDGAKDAISNLKKSGVKTLMLTGDNEKIAQKTNSLLAVDGYFADLTPEEKVKVLNDNCANNGMFVGDGINDAPVLATASVGVAMGSGTDVAIESADVIVTDNDLNKIPSLIKLAKKTMAIVYENIIASIGVKALVLGLSLFVNVPIWLAIFADVGVLILATLNSLRLSLNKAERSK